MKKRDGLKRLGEVTTVTPMIPKNAPALEPRDGMLDPSPPSSMSTPGPVPYDSIATKPRRHELRYSAITSIGEDASVVLAQSHDRRAAVVDGIVAIARTARCHRTGSSSNVRPTGGRASGSAFRRRPTTRDDHAAAFRRTGRQASA